MEWSAPGIARTFGVARQTLSGWLKEQGNKHPDLDSTLGDVSAEQDGLEYDELQHFVQKKAKSAGSGPDLRCS
jgi:transposase-like protein